MMVRGWKVRVVRASVVCGSDCDSTSDLPGGKTRLVDHKGCPLSVTIRPQSTLNSCESGTGLGSYVSGTGEKGR